MRKEKWIWMPHAGHFILGDECRFHLNTYVGGYIVSTVGEYWPDSEVRKIHAQVMGKKIAGRGDEWDANYMREFGFTAIGLNRLYETMVFKARRANHNGEDWQCCPWEMVNPDNVDFAAYNTATDAYKGHLKMCRRWAKRRR